MDLDLNEQQSALERAVKAAYWTEADARAVLAAAASSGSSLAKFARTHALSAKRLCWWRVRLGLVAPKLKRKRPTKAVKFARVVVSSAAAKRTAEARAELQLQSGLQLRVDLAVDGAVLARLVRALQDAGC